MEPGWRANAYRAIRAYPGLRDKVRDLHRQQVTAAYGGTGGGGSEAHRSTEDAATRQLQPDEQRDLDAVARAIDVTMARHADTYQARMTLISLMYWKEDMTIDQAAQYINYSFDGAARLHSEFVELVDAYLR